MKTVQGKFNWRGKLTPLKPEDVQYIIIHHAAVKEASPVEMLQKQLEKQEKQQKEGKDK